MTISFGCCLTGPKASRVSWACDAFLGRATGTKNSLERRRGSISPVTWPSMVTSSDRLDIRRVDDGFSMVALVPSGKACPRHVPSTTPHPVRQTIAGSARPLAAVTLTGASDIKRERDLNAWRTPRAHDAGAARPDDFRWCRKCGLDFKNSAESYRAGSAGHHRPGLGFPLPLPTQQVDFRPVNDRANMARMSRDAMDVRCLGALGGIVGAFLAFVIVGWIGHVYGKWGGSPPADHRNPGRLVAWRENGVRADREVTTCDTEASHRALGHLRRGIELRYSMRGRPLRPRSPTTGVAQRPVTTTGQVSRAGDGRPR